METTLNLYQRLLEVYTEKVKGLEEKKKILEAEIGHQIGWIPHMVLNSRMFTYDEYLTNIHHGGFCFEEKNHVMPHLINFLAAYEKSSEEDRGIFENLKPKSEYQKYLDTLYLTKGDFSEFLQFQLKELQDKENSYRPPFRPQRRNATRQLAKYREDMNEYEEKIDSINRCRQEVTERINLYNHLLNS
jgi:hypothetical protein